MGTLVFQANLGGAVNLVGPNTASTVNFTLPSADGSSGQALVTNGSGTLSFSSFVSAAAGSNTQVQFNSSGAFAGSANLTFNGTTLTAANTSVTTSETLSYGTANGVAYLNGSKVVTTGSALTFDGTNLGIGTASPNTKLTINQGNGDGVFVRSADTNYSSLALGVSTGGGYTYLQSSSAGSGTTQPVAFFISASEQMRLTSTGLGIGTTSPGYKLDVQNAGGLSIRAYNSSSTSPAQFRSTNTLTTVNFGVDNVGGYVETQGAYPTVFYTGGSERMRLDSSGNLGLGVTPSAWNTVTPVMQIGTASWYGFGNETRLSTNFYYASGDKYISNGYATSYNQASGQHKWFTAPSGTAGNAITFTQAMTLDASGRLGIGTTSPTVPLEIAQSATTYTQLRLTNTTAGNNGGQITFAGAGSVDMGWIKSNYPGEMLFGTYNGSSVAERARIDSSGNLLVGTTSAPSTTGIALFPSATGYIDIAHNTTGAAYSYQRFVFGGTQIGNIAQNSGGTAVAYNTSSDYRLKHDIAPMTGALAKVAALKPVTYKWNADDSDGEGFIAHELAEVCPHAVTGQKDAVDAEGNPVYQGIDTSFLVATLAAAIKELKAEFDAYKATHP